MPATIDYNGTYSWTSDTNPNTIFDYLEDPVQPLTKIRSIRVQNTSISDAIFVTVFPIHQEDPMGTAATPDILLPGEFRQYECQGTSYFQDGLISRVDVNANDQDVVSVKWTTIAR